VTTVSDPVPCPAHPESEPLWSRRNASDPKASLQALIDALIDIDVAYEREREHLNLSCLDFLSRTRSLKRLREQHQQRRQPLVQQLVALQDGRDLRG
jgi:hypothetical protein